MVVVLLVLVSRSHTDKSFLEWCLESMEVVILFVGNTLC